MAGLMEEPIVKYIDATWKGHNEHVSKWDFQIMNWIFTMHAGGVAGGLTYAASKGSSPALIWSVGCFALGLLLLLISGAIMIYNAFDTQKKFHEVVRQYAAEKISESDVFNWNADAPDKVASAEKLGWAAGLLAIPAVVLLIVAIA